MLNNHIHKTQYLLAKVSVMQTILLNAPSQYTLNRKSTLFNTIFTFDELLNYAQQMIDAVAFEYLLFMLKKFLVVVIVYLCQNYRTF